MTKSSRRLRIDVWSDIACPWCYVGKRRLERAVARFGDAGSIDIVWRSFELDPAAPRRSPPGRHAERLAKKYGMSVADAERRIAHLVDLARGEGLALDFDRLQPGNTFDAHRVLHHAREVGRQADVKERFLRGYFSEGVAIGDPAGVLELAVDAGLDADRVSAILASDAHAREARADEAEAQRLGIGGVPCFVIAGRYAVSGAQPAEVLLAALTRAWAELDMEPADVAHGVACGPDGC